jgi:hypothetical protein
VNDLKMLGAKTRHYFRVGWGAGWGQWNAARSIAADCACTAMIAAQRRKVHKLFLDRCFCLSFGQKA